MKNLGKVGFLITFLAISASIYFAITDKMKLDNCSKETLGILLSIHKQKNKAPLARIKYFIEEEGEMRKSYQSIDYQHSYHLGDSIKVRYACSDPSIMRIIE